MSAPSRVVTFLFTDIEGSTRRWEADADAMRTALEKHDAVLRDTVTDYGGEVFKHTGDGICGAFSSPRAAVDAAVAAQRSLELPVRMGIATGEAEMSGADYFGPVLNRAARVMSAGHGGQILLDGLTSQLLIGIDLMDLGSRRLRDITKPVQVLQVRAPGLRVDFPALRTVDPTLGNLRRPTTSFIGRESELDELLAALKAHRMVTLTGVGGVGKTRLALEVAARSTENYPDGVFVIELAAVGDPEAVPAAVAAALGVTQQPGGSLSESVATALDGRNRLLLFDNCEHVLDASANLIETILATAATVTVLATSREGLRLVDEQLWPLGSLDVTAGIDSAAAALFADRAHAVTPGLSLSTADDAEAVVEICHRLDGIPLAIELAASRTVAMTVGEVRDRLGDRFRLLVGSRRGLERHQTLRHAVQWSYDLLDDAERALLQRCSVFAGGFDLAAAAAVGGRADEFATLDVLDSLVRKSLVVADRMSARTRFAMLETIRQFAEDQLAGDGAADEARGTFARHFAGRATDVLALWDGPRQRDTYEWFTLELANLRAAFRWAADNDDLDTAAAIAVYATFLGYSVEQYEPVTWAVELIAAAEEVDHRRLAQIYVAAPNCHVTGRIDEALGYGEAGRLALATGRYGDVPYNFDVPALGGGYITKGQPELWVELCREKIARDPGPHIFTRSQLVFALVIAGAKDEALSTSEGLLAAAGATENPQMACSALLAYGFAHAEVDPIAAYDVLRRALTIAQDSGNRFVESHIADALSRVAATHGDPVDAFAYLTLAIRNYRDSGDFSFMPQPLAVLTALFDRLGRHESAATLSSFAATPLARKSVPEITTAITHLREILGDQAYGALADGGQNMTTPAMATYALEQIDLARGELE